MRTASRRTFVGSGTAGCVVVPSGTETSVSGSALVRRFPADSVPQSEIAP